MQYLLFAVTIVTAAVAVVMCVIVVRMLREDRRRSDARVEALLAITDSHDQDVPPARTMPVERTRDPVARVEYQRAEPAARDGEDLAPDPDPHVVAVEGLFAARETSSSWARRIGAAAVVAALVVAAVLTFGWRDGNRSAQDGTPVAQGPSAVPLELLSLTHTAEARALTITGLVQNPRGGLALANVTAVALLFSDDGGFIASGRAPLDFTRLDPGSDSPFVVKVSTSARVARYRISFRGPDGAVIAHIDKRSAAPLARRDHSGAP